MLQACRAPTLSRLLRLGGEKKKIAMDQEWGFHQKKQREI